MTVGALEGFMSVWSGARQSFGAATPQDGSSFDNSARLRQLQTDVESATPSSGWTGTASDTYADANSKQGRTLGAIADLDSRLAVEVNRSAEVVAAGRRDLDAVKQWVSAAASTLPNTAAREQMLWPVVAKGTNDVAEIMRRSHGDLSAIAERIRGIGDEYDELGKPDNHGAEPMNVKGDGDEQKGQVPETTLDLADIEYKPPGELGEPGSMELVPGSGVWVPDPSSPGYQPKPPEAPLDFNDIEYLGPGVKGQPWQMELVPGSGAWVPDPNYPGYQPSTPEAPVDLTEIQIADPTKLVPAGKVELWPHSGVLIPDPNAGRPF